MFFLTRDYRALTIVYNGYCLRLQKKAKFKEKSNTRIYTEHTTQSLQKR